MLWHCERGVISRTITSISTSTPLSAPHMPVLRLVPAAAAAPAAAPAAAARRHRPCRRRRRRSAAVSSVAAAAAAVADSSVGFWVSGSSRPSSRLLALAVVLWCRLEGRESWGSRSPHGPRRSGQCALGQYGVDSGPISSRSWADLNTEAGSVLTSTVSPALIRMMGGRLVRENRYRRATGPVRSIDPTKVNQVSRCRKFRLLV